jgi:hypothetical protein
MDESGAPLRLAFSSLSIFRNIDFVQATDGAARTCKPARASAQLNARPHHLAQSPL